ncbi:hypothetical protein JCGZ_11148 [Jatropha curcas]|uniref:Uncharacterized protein n=1 Tax=Jatropha curcas TaxID=180498 RepID=A0A067KQR5_JATCU|nr:hypothetical protein JCGZ_11148 [Jatropha curcas]
MARGRAFDSDESGSGARGGRGRGCSTRGRGGAIPPLFSSGKSGASSSAQLHVLPSLPSIPSSLTPLPGLVESSLASQSRTAPVSYASTASLGPQPDHSAEEITALRARVDEQERQLAELRAHVMPMSAQQQLLPYPLDPDTTDNTLVTPADTTTHLPGTPLGDTTLDRANDQPRRFDFGPF